MRGRADDRGRLPHVVIVGAGFGGLNCALRLARHRLRVTIVDRDNYHGFWPLLYQVATGGLGPEDISRPARAIFSHCETVTTLMGTVTGVDLTAGSVHIDGQPDLHYDYLVLAAGSSTSDFGIPGVAEHAFPLKTLSDAVELRNHLLTTWEKAEAGVGLPPEKALTVLLVGGGPTGVETAGAISELMSVNLARDYRRLNAGQAHIILVEMTGHLLSGFAPQLQENALRTLRDKGVDVRFGEELAEVGTDGARFKDGSLIDAGTIVWTAGVASNPLADAIPGEKGMRRSVRVGTDLSLPGWPDVFVIGDMADATDRHGRQLPQLAQVAIQGGRHAAKVILARTFAKPPPRPFRYHNHGIMATIGRRDAVAELPGGLTFAGTLGWLLWLGVHLVFLIGFRNRIVVLASWAYNYLTWDRSARVILARSGGPSASH